MPEDDGPEPVEVGERVTYIDADGEEHRALVVSPCPDAEYVSVVTSNQGQLGEAYTHSVETHTSVYPHPDEHDGRHSSETYSYRRGWD